jgi:cobalt-zinc-cadmium resistance protein CzcA
VQANVEDHDLGGSVDEVRRAVARRVQRPPGVVITYGGQFENQQRATRRRRVSAA